MTVRTRRVWRVSTGTLVAVWVFVVVGLLDTANAVVQSMRYSVFDEPLGVNWVIVTAYVPALLVSSYLIILELIRARQAPSSTARRLA